MSLLQTLLQNAGSLDCTYKEFAKKQLEDGGEVGAAETVVKVEMGADELRLMFEADAKVEKW